MDNILEKALYYRSLGWSVVPAKVGTISNGKAQKVFPIRWGEFQERIAGEEEIKKWYAEHPDWGIAVVCGKISNLAVLDVDDKNLDLGKYNLPETWQVKTGRGWHYYFKLPKGKEVRGTIQLEKGLELKGDGSTVHAPPTLYSGNVSYEWAREGGEIAELPDSLLQAIPERQSLNDGPKLYQVEGKINEGEGRNNAATSYAGHLLIKVPQKYWKELCWPALKQWNYDHCNPPLNKEDLGIIFNSIAGKERERINENTKETPLEIESLKELYEKELPPNKWVVENLVPYSGVTILSAPAGYFKTWVIIHLALKVAKGEELFNKFTTEKTGILFINEENYEGIMQDRIKKLTGPDDLKIYFLNQKNIKFNDETVEKILKFCKEKEIGLVIIDSLVRIHNLDENSATDVKKIFDQFKKFTTKNISLLLTHHHRKTGLNDKLSDNMSEQMRGSTDLVAMIDCHLMISKKDDYMVIHQPKQRLGELLKPFKVRMNKIDENSFELAHFGDWEGESNLREDVQQAIIRFLEVQKFATKDELVKNLSQIAGDTMIRANLRYLEDIENINSNRKGQGGRKQYFLPFKNEGMI